MDLQLTGRRAYVTGGARGIGLAIAAALADEGVCVAISDHDDGALRATAATLAGSGHIFISADLGSSQGVATANAAVHERFGVPDLLVNNVGRSGNESVVTATERQWSDSFELNLMCAVRTSRYFVPRMADLSNAAVINVSSDLAKQPESVPVEYGAMKAALFYVTKALALEYAPAVRVNAVLPGPTWTSLWTGPGGLVDQLASQYGTDRDGAVRRYLADRHVPMGIATPETIASLVAYLLSPLSAFINGSAYDVGGTIRALF
ncbi:SDR family NAD(P)-dependent oxidoreductase [Mycolicibacterium mageritense]|uniref:SDR family NAD(P)-dependent oxidoreductase n=1 Tax=Mycolicibacterium mageritense TaxID=53462 RepID=UPI001E5E7DAC|nr:SDR family oxidoreductase [Mycolicibacterium mageritense]GJJ21228.1 putative oxidoreductase YvrD [Mycolicibacterium mageritense]